MTKRIILCCLSFFVLFAVAEPVIAGGFKLTAKQSKKFAELSEKKSVTAFAASPDGPWGRVWGKRDSQIAAEQAIGYCREHLRRGKRDCVLYSLDGTLQNPKSPTKVDTVYTPGDGTKAPDIFGLVNRTIRFDREKAKKIVELLLTDPDQYEALEPDPTLTSLLLNRSIVLAKKKGFAIYFDDAGGEQFSVAKSGLIKLHFKDWVATEDGLVCLLNAAFFSGKRTGNKCLVLESIDKGKVSFAWSTGQNLNRLHDAYLVNGDARWGAVK